MTPVVRWRVALLLFLGGMLNYLDRSAISIASPAIKIELGLTTEQLGYVFSSFFVGYALLNLIGGWAADRFGPKKVMTFSIVAWSLLCGLTAAAAGFVSLIVIRILFGAAEGPFGATSAKIVNRCFPKREVSSAIALGASGTPIGALIAGPLVAILIASVGWRASLFVVAGVGVVFAIAWSRLVRIDTADNQGHLSAIAKDRTALEANVAPMDVPGPEDGQDAPGAPRRSYFLDPVVLSNAAAYFAYTYLLAMYLSWLPVFFVTKHHLDLQHAAFGSSAPWIMGFVGIWAGAAISDVIFRSSARLLYSRRVPQVGGLVVAAIGTALMGQASGAVEAVALASVALFALYVSGTSFWAIVQDVVPGSAVGRVSGFTHLVANVGGVLSPALTGAIVQRTNLFEIPWLVGSAVAGLATIGVLAVARTRP